ncbi:hypothetical protein PRIPAC_78485 [Pristionchus pacificus]|uniref:Zinc finger protein n=1 Tax=Pristionchus pacificus TaxID=54126 RepID=A0A2A6BHE3_PRIPA|nr:hypothetical protein PRIPAC_78485 [Pristionchus pacificus]|eukprot:PDM65312.1 zinc finger protein [Pristionchus pacificus]
MSYNPVIREETIAFVAQLREQNEMNESSRSVYFPCSCRASRSSAFHALDRVASTACGHAVCRACADSARDACPLPSCRRPTTFLKILDDDTRICPICNCSEPAKRAAFPRCGHTICCACFWQIRLNAREKELLTRCPLCRSEASSTVKPIFLIEPVLVRRGRAGGAMASGRGEGRRKKVDPEEDEDACSRKRDAGQ